VLLHCFIGVKTFTKEEFKKIIKEDFIKSKSDKIGFWCLTSISEDEIIGISGLLKCNYLNCFDPYKTRVLF
jgi:ribosomal-protein-alanine N-acetyltransferase